MTQIRNNRQTLSQFIRYMAVGVINTLVTLIVIAVCKSWLGINPFVSNAIGYVAGVINSFIWNRAWVFRANGHITVQAVKFIVGFGLCYAVQFAIVWGTMEFTRFGEILLHVGPVTMSGYGIVTIIGMGVYTICNFLYNKLVSFR